MKRLNKQLTVYLSKSLLIPDKEIKPVREMLTGLGFNVKEYYKENVYNPKLIDDADFVVFLTKEKPIMVHGGSWKTFVGKGQFDEAVRCSGKPAFMIHQMKSDDLLISKITGDAYKHMDHKFHDINDWKNKYGMIGSYTMGMSIVPLFPMLEGLFGLSEKPFSVEEVFAIMKPNNRLLLLLK